MSLLALFAALVVYTNPILWSDYSDPDVIEVDGTYWMTSSSFNCVPGLQILKSNNLIDWEIAGAALRSPGLSYGHGNGVWAPAIRYHEGVFYIFWGDPDRGIFEVHAEDPMGEWSLPHLVIEGKGLIDPCPLWNDDGRVWLVHGWAGSRAGFKSVLSVCELAPDLSRAISSQVMVFDGKATANQTVEGPKFYKRGSWYYIFAPAGGVKTGWQLVLRSKSVLGPYEWRKVLHQGTTSIHGPHQGAWVEDAAGSSWFFHFEDRGPFGRVVHLQPMRWLSDGWCVIGSDPDGDGIGEPVQKGSSPALFHGKISDQEGHYLSALATGTGFSSLEIPLNWQWHAAPDLSWYMTIPALNSLRLNCILSKEGWRNLWDTPNLLLEKIVGPSMEFTTSFDYREGYEGERVGLVVMGRDYSSIELVRTSEGVSIRRVLCQGASKGADEVFSGIIPAIKGGTADGTVKVFFRVKISEEALCTFSYSYDGKRFKTLGEPFQAVPGEWIGAKIGYYAISSIKKNDGGYVIVS